MSQLFDAVKRNPRRAIFAAAVISVLVSCYPVVFFGRSFVSANAVPMLYPGIPSLPGHDETETENFKGSDAGRSCGTMCRIPLSKVARCSGTGSCRSGIVIIRAA